MIHRVTSVLGVTLTSLVMAGTGFSQPDPSQMSGLPLPDGQLPDGTVSVRVIRGQLTNNVTGQPVELHDGNVVQRVETDTDGRARFVTLPPGVEVYAVTELDGEQILSQRFTVPRQGGIRLMLVGAVDPSVVAPKAEQGYVTFGDESWIQVELGEETVELYYLLDVVNMAQVPVQPERPIVFDVPPEAESTSVLQGSSPRTITEGTRVELPGPFQPGVTPLRVAFVLPYSTGSLTVSQLFPANLESLVLMVEKWGSMDITSELISRRADLTAEESGGTPYMLAGGALIPAGEALAFELTGLPHRDRTPVNLTLALATGMLGFGFWASLVSSGLSAATIGERRRTAEALKERLFTEFIKVERQYSVGKIGSTKHSTRRKELLTALERVYRELEEQPTSS